jgi:hypothetical protein
MIRSFARKETEKLQHPNFIVGNKHLQNEFILDMFAIIDYNAIIDSISGGRHGITDYQKPG